jgi:hypothetical protein
MKIYSETRDERRGKSFEDVGKRQQQRQTKEIRFASLYVIILFKKLK